MPVARLPHRVRRQRRRLSLRLARARRALRQIGAPRVHGITPEVRRLIDGHRGVF